MVGDLKEVNYDKYCDLCVHEDKDEREWPCFACLANDARVDSHKPEYFEAKSEPEKGKKG